MVNNTIRGGIMPSYRSIEIPSFHLEAKIKPLGVRRFIRCLPYITGNNARFDLTLNWQGNDVTHRPRLYFITPDRAGRQVSLDEVLVSMGQNMVNTRISSWIADPGHYSLEITYSYGGMNRAERMVEFTAQSKDLLITDWFIRFVFLIIGAIIGWLIKSASGV
jgi:hypothetical protein